MKTPKLLILASLPNLFAASENKSIINELLYSHSIAFLIILGLIAIGGLGGLIHGIISLNFPKTGKKIDDFLLKRKNK